MTDRYTANFSDYDELMLSLGNPVNPPGPFNDYIDKGYSTEKNAKFEEPLNTYTDKHYLLV